MMPNATPPTKKEIDTLAQMYSEAQAAADAAQEKADVFYDRLVTMTKEHGCAPPRAEKSLRIDGDAWQVTLSEGQSVSVKQPPIKKIFEMLKRVGLLAFFDQLFVTETTYKLAKGAQLLMAGTLPKGAPSNLRKLFTEAVTIKDKAPTLKVELLKKEEPKS